MKKEGERDTEWEPVRQRRRRRDKKRERDLSIHDDSFFVLHLKLLLKHSKWNSFPFFSHSRLSLIPLLLPYSFFISSISSLNLFSYVGADISFVFYLLIEKNDQFWWAEELKANVVLFSPYTYNTTKALHRRRN